MIISCCSMHFYVSLFSRKMEQEHFYYRYSMNTHGNTCYTGQDSNYAQAKVKESEVPTSFPGFSPLLGNKVKWSALHATCNEKITLSIVTVAKDKFNKEF